MVKVHSGLSSRWRPKRGLREGRPSSPPLFEIYHDGVMQDFRVRRKRKAEELDVEPGLKWNYKVDGRIKKKMRDKDIVPGGEG